MGERGVSSSSVELSGTLEEKDNDRDVISQGLLPEDVGRERVDSKSDSSSSDSSADGNEEEEADEAERPGEYVFDPVTEYMIKHGRQNAKLDMAWDFYAKYILPRFTRAADGSGSKYRLMEPGEEGGQFYSLWKTPMSQLGDFGLGIGWLAGRGGERSGAEPLVLE